MPYAGKEAQEELDRTFAFYYVFKTAGNASNAWKMLADDRGWDKKHAYANGPRYFAKSNVKKYIAEYQAEARAKEENIKDICFNALLDVISDPDTSKRDRISAVKEMKAMTGLDAAAKIDLNANVDTDINISLNGFEEEV